MEPVTNDLTNLLRAKGNHYSLLIIQLAMQLFIDCGSSLRGIEKIFTILHQICLRHQISVEKIPHNTSIRKWFLRIGLYELQKEKEYREDWIFIVDLTVELGNKKAMVILGISQEYLKEKIIPYSQGLSHKDVQILALEIMDSTKGELIEDKLNQLSKLVGSPIQIIADHGSDLACGIKRYQQNNPKVIYTHDVTHAIALILKHELLRSEKYQSFLKHCNQCRQELQQTKLSFLSPPSQRSQCRYFNVEKLVDWAIKFGKSPFDTLVLLVPDIEPDIIRKKLVQKFGWILDYESDLERWSLMTKMTRTLENQLKLSGLNQKSLETFEKTLSPLTDNSLLNFKQNILNYLAQEIEKISDKNTYLATSDILESLFGKYKSFSERSPLKQISQLLLTISLSTMNLTASVLQEALKTVRFADVEIWIAEVFGSSMLSKRKTLFSATCEDIETA